MCTFAFILRLIIAFSFSINYDDKKGNLVVFLVSYAITFGVFIPLYFLLCKNKTNKEKSKE
jgi:heme/copper-type cytochrome/quinol oxidase subunit 3